MSIQQLRQNPEIAAAAVANKAFKRGAKGPHVALYQQALFNLGHDLPRSTIAVKPRLEFDGIFGEETEEQTKQFQTEQSLKDDGIVGEQTVFGIFTAVGILPLAVPHNPKLLSLAERKFRCRAAVTAALSETYIREMNFYLGTLKVWASDYRRMRQHLSDRRITVLVLPLNRYYNVKDRHGYYYCEHNTIVLDLDRDYFTIGGQEVCIHELTHAIMDDRMIPFPSRIRGEAICYLAGAFYLVKRYRKNPGGHLNLQPLINAVLSGAEQKSEDIRALEMAVVRMGYKPLPGYRYVNDGIR